jgi:hypothetical protein
VQVGYGWGIGSDSSTLETEQALRLDAGLSFPIEEWLRSGITIGYEYARHEGITPPSWQDALTVTRANGAIPSYGWERHALVFGPAFTAEAFPCRPIHACSVGVRRWQLLFVQVEPLLDAGFIVPDATASRFPTYVGARSGAGAIFDPRLLLRLEAGLDRHFDDDHDVAFLAVLQGSGGPADFRRVANLSGPRQIGYREEWTAGFGVQMRWGL